ncbi:nucleolar and coiled-body phosphoprotein 1-like [Cardiocondyla obscurior]|uniref:nucleolar and coiled-body phosphoprotein 1-like n=1 Tax=Cardiocondyla obscurior TaxID=286306 RepID=UPI0039658220
MSQSNITNTGVPPQGDRIPRGRREGNTVPVPLPLSSNDGPPAACTAGVAAENTPASSIKKAMRPDKPGPASSKREGIEKLSPYQSPVPGRRTSRASSRANSRANSPTPSIASTSADVLSDAAFLSGVDEDSSMDISATSSVGSRSRKRGRPPTTGEYVGLAQAKLRLLEVEQEVAHKEEVSNILDSSYKMTAKLRETSDSMVEGFMAELRDAPLEDLAARVFESQEKVLKVASVSKGLKGTMIKALKEAACVTRASTTLMASRSSRGAETDAESRFLTLSKELDDARKEIRNLHEEIRNLRSRAAELPVRDSCAMPPPSGRPNRRSPPPAEHQETTVSKGRTRPAESRSGPSRRRSPSMDEAEEALIQRLDGLFNKWFERRFGSVPPGPMTSRANQEVTSVPLSAGKSKPPDGGTKKALKPAPSSSRRQQNVPSKNSGRTAKPRPSTSAGNRSSSRKRASGTEDESRRPPPVKSANTAEANNSSTLTWSKVVGRKTKSAKPAPVPSQRGGNPKGSPGNMRAQKSVVPQKRKIPKNAAVIVSCAKDNYAEVLKYIKTKVSLDDLGIPGLKSRRALTGAIIYEISGEDSAAKADVFMTALKAAVGSQEGVKISRPIKMGEFRVRGLDDSACESEVTAAIVKLTACDPNDIRVGTFRHSNDGLSTTVVRCPATVANKVVAEKR